MTAKIRRPTYEDYPDWLFAKLSAGIGAREETHYETASQLIQQQTLQGAFWNSVIADMSDAASQYSMEQGFPLFASSQQSLDLDRKRWASFRLKTYRKNVRENLQWPKAPRGGWVIFPSWYGQVGDIVRTLIVVRYLDGMAFLANRLVQLATQHGLQATTEPIARGEGYYATHVNVYGRAAIPGIDWDALDVDVSLEIQITTQLQDNIRQLLHGAYELARESSSPADWRWDYNSAEFRTNYLGHVLHYVEGMVMAVREQRVGDEQTD